MRKFIIIALAASLLGGCAAIQRDVDTFTTAFNAAQGQALSQKTVFVAVNAFDLLEVTATNYLEACPPKSAPTVLCLHAREVAAVAVPAIRSGIIVRNKIKAAARRAGDQPIAAGADWDTFKSIAATLREVLTQYGITVPGV